MEPVDSVAGAPAGAPPAAGRGGVASRPTVRAFVAATAVTLAGALVAAYYLSWPFTTDQGIFAWVAERIVAGGVPYRDAWDTKGPAAYYLTAPAVLLFGHHQWGFRLYDLLWLAAGAAALASLVRRVALRAGVSGAAAKTAALTAAALLVLWFLSLDPYNTGQPDGWAAFLLTIGAAALVRGARRGSAGTAGAEVSRTGPSLAAAALFGACVGVATLVKPTYGLYGFIALVYLAGVVRGAGRPWRALAPSYASLAGGFVAVLVLCAAWFAARGALDDMLDVTLRFGPMVYAQTSADPLLVRVRLMEGFVATRFSAALPFVVAALVWLQRRAPAEGAMLLTWLACVFANVLLQGRDLDFAYRWLSLYPAVAALAALGLLAIRETIAPTGPSNGRGAAGTPRVAAALTATVLAVSALKPAYYAFRWLKYAAGRSDASEYYMTELGPEYGWYGGPESMGAVVDYVRSHSSPADAVLVWDAQPGVNFLARRRSPVRFAWSGALTYGAQTRFRPAYRREYLASVAADPPLYVITLDDATCARHSSESLWCLKSFPELQAWVGGRYEREARIYSHDLWRRVR